MGYESDEEIEETAWEPSPEQLALRIGDAVVFNDNPCKVGWVFGSPVKTPNGWWYVLARDLHSDKATPWHLSRVTPFVP